MNFLRKLFGSAPAQATSDGAIYLYVRCNKCQSVLRVRIDPRNEISPEFDGDAVSGYMLRKEMMDSKCFRLMYATLHFDSRRQETSREIEGGTFISAEDYAQAMQPVAS